MAARFLVVPQWQGSGSDRAMRLVEGAEAILADLPTNLAENKVDAVISGMGC